MKKRVNALGLLALILMTGLVLVFLSPALFLRLLSWLGILMLILSSLVMVVTFRKAKAVKPQGLVLSMGISLGTAVLYTWIASASPGGGVLCLGLIFGALAGIGWGLTNSFSLEGRAVRSQGNAWYLLVWALTLAVPQSLAVLTGRPPAVGMVLLFGGTGLVLGQSGFSLWRYLQLKSQLTYPAGGSQ